MSASVIDPIVHRAASAPDAPALRAGHDLWSNARLLDAVDRAAGALLKLGVGAGDRVATLLEDGPASVVMVHAARRVGAVLMPLNRRAAASELRYQLEGASVALLITDATNAATAERAGRCRIQMMDELETSQQPRAEPRLRDRIAPEAAATIIFTSGTTGRPKGALLSQGNHLASADAWAAVLRPAPTDRWLACLPLYHVAGLAIVGRAAHWGAELEIHDRFDAVAVADALARGVTHVSLVATQLERLLAERRSVPRGLKAILLGGGPTPSALLARALELGYPVLTTYGMTETASGVAVGAGSSTDDPVALRPLPGVDFAVTARGELRVRGPMVFTGYLDEAGDVPEPSSDGWFDTGDLGRLDADGLIHISDRRPDLFVSGGENVYPAEIEAVLRRYPGVVDAATTGRADPRWGTVPVALVVPGPGVHLDERELASHCRRELAGFKVPVRFYEVDRLPRDELGKIRAADMAAMVEIHER